MEEIKTTSSRSLTCYKSLTKFIMFSCIQCTLIRTATKLEWGNVQQLSQISWLNTQKREHLEATYQRMKQAAAMQPSESEGSEDRSIREFESPQQMIQQQYQQHYQQGYYDGNSQNIEDPSQQAQSQQQMSVPQSDMSHPGF